MISVRVDGRQVDVPEGASVLDAVNASASYLPQLCKDPDRPRLGTCRTCLVAIDGVRGTPTACSTPAEKGMVISTESADVVRIRSTVLQLTLDMLQEKDLDRLGELGVAAGRHGLTPGRYAAAGDFKPRKVDASNPLWELDRQRCIECARCVDACQNVQHIHAIALLGRSRRVEVGTFRHGELVDSNCTSCGQCLATCPTLAIRQKRPITASPGPLTAAGTNDDEPTAPIDVFARGDGFPSIGERVETTCPYCGVGCGIHLNLSGDGHIIQVEDVPANESSRGMLCVKGRFGVGFVESPDRLKTPLIRRKRGGPLEPAGWDEAMELVTERLAEHRGRFAALGSAKTTNEDSYVLQKLARVVMGTNNIDHCSRLCHAPSVSAMLEMLGSGGTTNSYEDYEQAGCIMVVGSDTDANHPVIASRLRKGIEEGGARLIVVNPRRTRLVDLADVWLRPRPGSDVALFNGLARIALDMGLWDQDFVTRRAEGFEIWREALRPYTSAAVARLCDVDEADLIRAAQLFARPHRGGSCLLWGMGITQHTSGVANVQAMVNLALLTGQVGKPGSGLSPLRGQNNVQGCSDAGVLPDTLPGYQGLGEEVRGRFGRVWGVVPPSNPGLKLTEMIDASIWGELKALYLVGENPMLTEPNLEHTRAGLSALEFLVVQNIFLNETADLADVVLPAATFAEKDGTFTNSERRIQRVRKALDPLGEARADWEITCDLARRLANRFDLDVGGFDYAHPGEIFDEMSQLVPAMAGVSYDRLEQGGLQWPCPTPEHPGTSRLFADAFPRGRALFVSVDQGPRAAEVPDEDYPLILNTGRVLYHWHGGDLTRRVDGLMALYPQVEITIHPDDAPDALRDGDDVRIASRRGSMTGIARLSLAQRRGEIFTPFVRLDDGSANLLTNDALEPRVKIPEYKACAVRIQPA